MKEFIFSKIIIVILSVVILIVIVACLYIKCFGKTYTIDYCGEKECYEGKKDSYPAGTKVKLYYNMIATDTDYSFYLDGQPLQYNYDSEKGFIIQFIMPKQDVKLECIMTNSMVQEALDF